MLDSIGVGVDQAFSPDPSKGLPSQQHPPRDLFRNHWSIYVFSDHFTDKQTHSVHIFGTQSVTNFQGQPGLRVLWGFWPWKILSLHKKVDHPLPCYTPWNQHASALVAWPRKDRTTKPDGFPLRSVSGKVPASFRLGSGLRPRWSSVSTWPRWSAAGIRSRRSWEVVSGVRPEAGALDGSCI